MQRDIRATELYKEIEALCACVRRPGTGSIWDASEVDVSNDGQYVAFSGTLWDALEGAPSTRICLTHVATGDTRVMTFGPNTDRLPKLAPDGRRVAFLSDRARADDYQLYLLDRTSGAAVAAPPVEGWVEYLQWSPDGKRILLGVAGHGADISGGQGAVTSKQTGTDVPSWMPTVESGDEEFRWRSLWVYDLASGSVRKASRPGCNVWEATWCGNDAFAAVISPAPDEGLWYSATLHIIGSDAGESRQIYVPQDQMGWPHASPSGRKLAIVDAICSDRWIVAGELYLVDPETGCAKPVDTNGVDVSCTQWCSEDYLLVAGHRGFESVVGFCDGTGVFTETWSSREITTGGRYMKVAGFGADGDCALIGESYLRAPAIAVIRKGQYEQVRSFDLGYSELVQDIGPAQPITWSAADGLALEGWLLAPRRQGPHATIMNVHGGPVWHWRPTYLGRSASVLSLLRRGYAVFFPNPRGSSGRGKAFARQVYGDIGGADAHDLLAGIDELVRTGRADPARLGVTGGSYGGFMTAWLVCQDGRFAAAIPVSPHTNQVTEHLLSNIPHFMALLLADRYDNPAGQYFQRSPVMHARRVKTPVLQICGAVDRCTPPEEAAQFHNALRENGALSTLITYPGEGHGVRRFPAAVDYAARIVGWFMHHMGAGIKPADDKGRESRTGKQ